MSRRGLFWIGLAFALSAALVLGWIEIMRVRYHQGSVDAWNAEVERQRTADRSCMAAMRGRDPIAEAEADVRRGTVRPIFLGIGDDIREIVALGLADCSPHDIPDRVRSFPASCAGDLAGPHQAVTTYAGAYNQRLQALAPRQVGIACQRPFALTGRLPPA